MAGESPDRSKQRESSARRTSGSASPVPEARSEAADPRLAVARDTEKSSARGGADTATRVLSTRTAQEPENSERPENDSDAESAASDSDTERAASDSDAERAASGSDVEDAAADAGRAAGAADAEEAGSDSDTENATADAGRGASGAAEGPGGSGSSDGEGSDGRLRDAVAAWVASADGEKETAAEADDEAPGAERAEKAAKPEETDADAQKAGKADADARGGQDGAEGSGGDAGVPAGPDTDDEDGKEAAGAAPEGSKAAQAHTDEPAADRSVTTDDGDDADVADTAEANADERAAGSTDDTAPEAADTVTDADTESKASGADTESKASGAEAESKVADGDADAAERDGDKGRAPADPRVSTDAGAAPKAAEAKTAGAETATDVDAVKDDAPADGTAEDKPGIGKTPKTGEASATPEDKPGTDKTPKTGGAAGSTVAAGDAGDGDGDGAPTEPPVDQPTAVFKVLRPPVDQPTTMLKLGGAAKDLPKSDLPKTGAPKTDGPKTGAPKTDGPKTDAAKTDGPKKAAPERDAERTSKFVALKPLDDPAARKPVAPADATAPVPTVGPERTTQQPLPPKPPLDLLAELTNTPPPPETPLRTAARRVKIWTPLVLLLVVVFAVVQSVRPLPAPTLELTAKDSYTFEGGKVDIPWPADGQAALDVQGIGTFGSSGEQKPVPIASVAKVMTAYLILREHPLKSGEDGPKILIDQTAQDQSDAGQESTVDVTKGDRITEREALESILIASANNIARLLARWDAGSEKAFVQKMNDAAEDIGMKNTTYTDPSGLNNTTVSTAVDQVKLARAAMQQPAFREVVAMMSYVDYKGTKHDNWNRLVGSNDVTGIKTGTTTSALGNLVFAAKKDVDGETHRIIGAVVRQPAGGPDNTILGAALHEGDKLIRAAQGALESATILKKGDVVGEVDDGLGGRTPVVVTKDVTAVGWAGLSVKLTFAGDDLPHTAEAGTKVGTLTVGDGTTSAVKVPVALQKDLAEPGFGAKLTRIG
ncbi:D-alanyl-D-alanine carboxypeptidase [Streptomyces sp. NPDC013187]|uniref:D-alanyl-D-alanine carboxypeptidase n=1 Tax=Streptomyces sp. NPDC013187 TaxID=3364865 RepID=UPI0036A2ABBC